MIKNILISVAMILLMLFMLGLVTNKVSISFITDIPNKLDRIALNATENRLRVDSGLPAWDSANEIVLEKVSNLGYIFYVGQIEKSNTANISDALKNDITRVVYNSKFPKSLLEKIPIIFVNNLALKSGQYISSPQGNMPVADFGPGFLYEGGVYATYQSGRAIIYLNKESLTKVSINDVLTHELGHAIGKTLTEVDWAKYYVLRNIPTGTPKAGAIWNLSPQEDFAEVYKNTFTGLGVRTYYGLLTPAFGSDGMTSCYKIYQDLYESYRPKVDTNDPTAWFKPLDKTAYAGIEEKVNVDPKMQSCRRDVMANPSKYPSDWQYVTPYKSIVGPKTKEFINVISNGLNAK